MEEISKLAYVKADELEQELKTVKHRVHLLEILYGTTPPPPDPDDTEDTPYVAPLPGEVLTTGQEVVVPVYYQTTSSTITQTFPYLHFICEPNTTYIAKLYLTLNILSDPKALTIELYIDDVLEDTYELKDPVVANYTIPFANAYISTNQAHRIHYKIVPSGGTGCVYKVVTAKFELLGSNVLALNAPQKNSVYYNNGIYYIAECEQGYSNYLIQSISGLNLNAPYTEHEEGVVSQKFCHSYERIDYVWQTNSLGYFRQFGNGLTHLVNYNDPTKYVTVSSTTGYDFLPDLNTYYGGVIIYTYNGSIYYYDVTKDFASRATRTVESSESYYVNVAGVKITHDQFNNYPQKAKLIATRNDGSNVFFSGVRNYYKVELGFGTNVHANYANEDGSIIDVYLRTYDQLVKKVLVLNPNTNEYELSSTTTIGTWQEYMEGVAPNYFTVDSAQLLTYHKQ
jgi:hypothetical protein